MMMGFEVGIETLGVPRAFDNLGQADLLKSQEGTIYRV